MSQLAFENLSLAFGASNRAVVAEASLILQQGETLALVGESGSGKSLSALAAARLLPNDCWVVNGQVRLDGQSITDLPEGEMPAIRGRRIAMIFQEPSTALNPVMTIGEQIAESLTAHQSLTRSDISAKTAALLAQVGLDASRAKDFPFQFSGGQKQRIMIAIALASEPDILLADEPTTALDVLVAAEILSLLKTIQAQRHLSILLISHDLATVKAFANRVVVMQAGRVVENAPATEFFALPTHPYSQALLKAAAPQRSERKLATPANAIALRVEGASVAYRNHAFLLRRRFHAPTLNALSFELKAGETLALLGGSGSGKTTLAKALMGLLPSDAQLTGTFSLGDASPQALSAKRNQAARQAMQLVFQDPFASLNPRLSVGAIVSEGLAHLMPQLSADERSASVASALEKVGLPADAALRYPHQFSGGQRQRIAIARALVLAPRVLILDEPTSALDVTVQATVLDLLKSLQAELGLAYLLITHNMAVVEQMAHRVMVLESGQLVESGDALSVLDAPQAALTKRLLAAVPRL